MNDGDRRSLEPALHQNLTVAELLEDEVMASAELVAGRSGVNKAISALNVMTVPEIDKWVRKDEFLLATGYPLPRTDRDQGELLRGLHGLGLAGIGIKLDQYMPELSQDLIEAADRLGLPLVVIPERIRFDDILSRGFSIIVNRQAAALARAQEIHHSFLGVTLSGGGLVELARQLSSLLNDAGVAIADPQGGVLAVAGDDKPLASLMLLTADGVNVSMLKDPPHQAEPSERRWAARAIRAGKLHHGYVVAAEGSNAFGEFGLVALDQAAIVAALEVTRHLAVGAVERRFASNALYELVTDAESELAESASRQLGSGFGWDLERDIIVLVGRRESDSEAALSEKRQERLGDERAIEFWSSAVRSHDRSAAAAGLGSELVAVVGADRDMLAVTRSVQAELGQFSRGDYAIGVSRKYQGPAGIPVAYREARAALRLGHRVNGAGAITAYGDLGMFRLLAQVGEDELQAFAEEALGPLMALNEPQRSEMVKTLETLVRHNMNMAETARDLHFHYNTLRYRLAKLERLVGPFSTDTAVAIRVCVALQIREMQSNLGRRLR